MTTSNELDETPASAAELAAQPPAELPTEPPTEPPTELPAEPKRSTTTLRDWLQQGLRTAFFMRPDWTGLHATPGLLAGFLLAATLIGLLWERLYIVGPADFYWQGLVSGWFSTAVLAWVCWWLMPGQGQRQGQGQGQGQDPATPAAGAVASPWRGAELFTLLMAQGLPISLLSGLLLVPIVRLGWAEQLGPWGGWLLWGAGMAWDLAAQLLLMGRCGMPARRGLAGLLVIGTTLLWLWAPPPQRWYARETPESKAEGPQPLRLTQALIERQAGLLNGQLQALKPGRSGQVELYALSFAPYASEDVFMRESVLVDQVMQTRFQADGRSLQLVNNASTATELPWATPLNLQRAIQGVAARMNRDEDVLFIHLSSHGARDGKLAASMWPLSVDEVTPQLLRQWLDEAGIRYRVLSVSACYSGSWIEPLADEASLVMTAADADHTSYGCGKGSALTFFGRAMYAEQLQQTRSFEAAHAAARLVIDQREKAAGKSDGYSNPQIRVGRLARQQLEALTAQLGGP